MVFSLIVFFFLFGVICCVLVCPSVRSALNWKKMPLEIVRALHQATQVGGCGEPRQRQALPHHDSPHAVVWLHSLTPSLFFLSLPCIHIVLRWSTLLGNTASNVCKHISQNDCTQKGLLWAHPCLLFNCTQTKLFVLIGHTTKCKLFWSLLISFFWEMPFRGGGHFDCSQGHLDAILIAHEPIWRLFWLLTRLVGGHFGCSWG